MSFVGHVDCHRMVMGPVWPFAIIGNARAVAPAAPARNLRRVGFAVLPFWVASVMASSVVIGLWRGAMRRAHRRPQGLRRQHFATPPGNKAAYRQAGDGRK